MNPEQDPTIMNGCLPFQKGAAYYLHHLEMSDIPFEAHRSDHYAVCLLSEGEMKVETNLFVHHAVGPSVFVIAPGVIRRFLQTEKISKATVLFFDKVYFLQNQANIHFLDKFDFLEQKDQHIIDLDELQHLTFLHYFQQIEQKVADTAPHTPDIVRSFIYILLNELDDISGSRSRSQSQDMNRNERLLLEFKALLTQHFLTERHLAFYAAELHVTPKYLSAAVKEASGKTAGDWISEMLLLEAKVLLQDMHRSIAQIADQLRFTDPSHFGKFFKVHTGQSPLLYRSQL